MRHVFVTFKGRYGGFEGVCHHNALCLCAESDYDVVGQLHKGFEHVTDLKVFVVSEGEALPAMLEASEFRAVIPGSNDVIYLGKDND